MPNRYQIAPKGDLQALRNELSRIFNPLSKRLASIESQLGINTTPPALPTAPNQPPSPTSDFIPPGFEQVIHLSPPSTQSTQSIELANSPLNFAWTAITAGQVISASTFTTIATVSLVIEPNGSYTNQAAALNRFGFMVFASFSTGLAGGTGINFQISENIVLGAGSGSEEFVEGHSGNGMVAFSTFWSIARNQANSQSDTFSLGITCATGFTLGPGSVPGNFLVIQVF